MQNVFLNLMEKFWYKKLQTYNQAFKNFENCSTGDAQFISTFSVVVTADGLGQYFLQKKKQIPE